MSSIYINLITVYMLVTPRTLLQLADQQNFPVKDQIANILGSGGQTVSVANTQLCCCNVKAAINQCA